VRGVLEADALDAEVPPREVIVAADGRDDDVVHDPGRAFPARDVQRHPHLVGIEVKPVGFGSGFVSGTVVTFIE